MAGQIVKFITALIVYPVFLLKYIGDFVIRLSVISLRIEYQTYRLFLGSIEQIKHVLTNIKLPQKRKKRVIYRKKIKLTLLIRQKLKLIKFPRLPYPIRLLFIKIKFFLLGGVVVALGVAIFQLYFFVKALPNPVTLTTQDIPTTSKIYDRKGRLLYEIYAEKNRTPIALSDIPLHVKNATIATEDQEFYFHSGFSARGIIRAVYNNLTTDSLEGGSTITQQLIRNAFLTPEKTFIRKLKEVILSIWTEQLYSKDQILEMYLNQVPYGGTAWGIEAASQTYFGKSVRDLTLSEAALLSGLPASPSLYSPFGARPEYAKQRQVEVLKRMRENGFISLQDMEKATNESFNYRNPRTAITAPHFVMYVKSWLEKYYGTRLVEQGGLRITTSLDLDIQEQAQKTVSKNLELLRQLYVSNGAVLVTNPKTGEILAMVGSKDYFDLENDGNVNVTMSLRQPGSSIKVVNYAKALDLEYTPATILDDSPVTYNIPGQLSYTPVNYDGKYHGKVTLRTALASSYNIPAVKVLATIGIKRMIDLGRIMGITSWTDENRFGLSLTLGGGEVTMWDMAKVYGTLANSGKRTELKPVLKITDYNNQPLPLPPQFDSIQAVPEGVAFILSSILSDNSARTPAFGPNSALVIPGKTVAVKTGTSDNKRDNWTIGYTPDYLVAVWVGNNDNSPMHPTLTSGITGAAPIWQEIMINILKDREDKPFLPPNDIISVPCYGRIEYFIAGTEPKGGCPRILPLSPQPSP